MWIDVLLENHTRTAVDSMLSIILFPVITYDKLACRYCKWLDSIAGNIGHLITSILLHAATTLKHNIS
jgi:hypothetical protein